MTMNVMIEDSGRMEAEEVTTEKNTIENLLNDHRLNRFLFTTRHSEGGTTEESVGR
jgi:hypothetical protein